MSPSRWFPVIKTTVAGRRAFTVLSSMTLRRNPYARALARLREMRGLTVEIETACVESAGTSADSDAVPEGLCETCDRVLALCGHLQYSCGSHFLGWSPVDVFEPLRSSVSTGSQPGLAWAQVREFVSRLADYRRSGCDWDAAERWLEESDLAAGPWSEPDVAAFRRWRMDLFSAVSRTHSCVLSSVSAAADSGPVQALASEAEALYGLVSGPRYPSPKPEMGTEVLRFGDSVFQLNAVRPGPVSHAVRTVIPMLLGTAESCVRSPGAVEEGAVALLSFKIAELRAMNDAVMAECERAPGHPESALSFWGLGLRGRPSPYPVFGESGYPQVEGMGPSEWVPAAADRGAASAPLGDFQEALRLRAVNAGAARRR